jgi:hypothetical protein
VKGESSHGIIATSAEYFDKLEASTMGEMQRPDSELIWERIKAIDGSLFHRGFIIAKRRTISVV